jgi:2'-5' RNA ligase
LRLRLFFALWPDQPTRAALTQAARPLLGACSGRPVPVGNYHVTLAFLGSVPAARLDPIRAAAATIRAPAFELGFDCHGHWSRARVAWLGCRQPPAAAELLARSLWTALSPLGFEAEQRPFRPHLTVLRDCRSCEWPGPVTPVAWPVRDFALLRSETLPQGARYEIVERWRLSAD